MVNSRATGAISLVARAISFALIAIAMAFALLLIAQRIFNPFHVVASNSMSPQLKVGDAVIVKDLEPENVRIGQVIVFTDPKDQELFIVHRVVAVEENGEKRVFITKGDNNPVVDDWVVTPAELVGGVAVNLPHFGSFLDFLGSPRGYLSCIAIPAVAAIIMAMLLGLIEKAEKDRERARRKIKARSIPEP